MAKTKTPQQPPVDNDHVAPGAEPFAEGAAAPIEGVYSIERADALPEVEYHPDNVPFKRAEPNQVETYSRDFGVTLRQVVLVAGGLATQPLPAAEA